MKKLAFILIILTTVSCEKILIEKDPDNNPSNNFEYLWTKMDENYSFFSYKDVDWNLMYDKYKPRIADNLSDQQLFSTMTDMLNELRDGHVNLFSSFNIGSNHDIFRKSPPNFNWNIVSRNYLKNNYETTGYLLNTIIDSVGYIYYPSFSVDVEDYQLDYVINKFKDVKGIIIDIRNNGGGSLDNAFNIASRFTETEKHVYTTYHKNGPGHEDFAKGKDIFLTPSASTKILTKKIVVLTNEAVYSAANFFTAIIKTLPNVVHIGDTTGGGGGVPRAYELPNGWICHFSASKSILPNGYNIETGIAPDIVVNITASDEANGIDTIIEKAIDIINKYNTP